MRQLAFKQTHLAVLMHACLGEGKNLRPLRTLSTMSLMLHAGQGTLARSISFDRMESARAATACGGSEESGGSEDCQMRSGRMRSAQP